MAVTLEDAWEKLRWAKKHFEPLRLEIEAFEQRASHRLSVNVDKDAGSYTFHIHGVELVDPDWGLRIGDCLHNARAALDYLMVRLVALATGEEPRNIGDVQFPIYDKPESFTSRTGGLRKNPLFSGYLTRIEELQPFNNGNPSIWGVHRLAQYSVPVTSPLPPALQRLSELDNIDKHRVIHASWIGGAAYKPRPMPSPPGVPPNFHQQSESFSTGPLEDGAEVGSMRFETPLPGEWEPDEMEMKAYFPVEVAFADPEHAIVNAVLEVVPYCLWGVESVLEVFDPVFSHGEPPRPVTSTFLPGLLSPVRPLPPAL